MSQEKCRCNEDADPGDEDDGDFASQLERSLDALAEKLQKSAPPKGLRGLPTHAVHNFAYDSRRLSDGFRDLERAILASLRRPPGGAQ